MLVLPASSQGFGLELPTWICLAIVPLIGADRSRIESYRERAAAVARGTGCKVRLKLFGAGVVIDEIRG